ncbi:MAG: molybdenum ABC transporter ATP-binding protein [Magnetococcales bacterium]|nr:molybdenum ABC transporter ATP-binding protein [Magnetococcales bacterium]
MKLEARFKLIKGDFTLNSNLATAISGVTGLFGPSGSGKTTFLRCLAGLERATQGYLRFGDDIWQDEAKNIFLPPHQRPVGVVFQENRLFKHLTVKDNLLFGRKRSKNQKSSISWDGVVQILELEPLLNRHPQGLSGGEQQRVAIGRAILSNPELLIMDEPLASMDQTGSRRILGFISSLQNQLQLPILHVSHDMGEILQLADYLAVMESGEIIATGPISDMMTSLELPLAHRSDASTVLTARVVAHDPSYHLNHLEFGEPAQRLFIANNNLAIGDKVRVRIFARDVSLALDHPSNTSILNLFPAQVVEVAQENPAQYVVKLMVGNSPILARITKKSLQSLSIKKGLSLIAQVKSIALER